MGPLRSLRVVAGGPVAPQAALLASYLGRIGGYVAAAQSRWASSPTLFRFLFPDVGWNTSSLPKQQKLSLNGFTIRVVVPMRVGCCGQGTRRVLSGSGWGVGSW